MNYRHWNVNYRHWEHELLTPKRKLPTLEHELLLWLWYACQPFSYQYHDSEAAMQLLHCGFQQCSQ
jgi:hypothetical protein